MRALVDIDDTLWSMSGTLYKKLKKVNDNVPPISKWKTWEFHKTYMDNKKFYDVVQEIHMKQYLYSPYNGSCDLLYVLYRLGYEIIIASHRNLDTTSSTKRWLEKHLLYYDTLHISWNKEVLLDKVDLIIDDGPIIQKCKEMGKTVVALKKPWNEESDIPLFDDLTGIMQFVTNLNRKTKRRYNE